MAIEHRKIVDRLARFPDVLLPLLGVVSAEDARWKPSPKDWSVTEVLCHLLDEEREDFRPRLQMTLADPASPWPALDLEGIAERRGYNERDVLPAAQAFALERRASLAWLRSLGAPRWDLAHQHPKFGPIAAGSLLASWAAHDALHLRQISKRLYQLASRDADVFPIAYAGDW